jgi:hypothetical protein
MAETEAKSALKEFEKDADRVEQLLKLIRTFRAFAGEESELAGQAKQLWDDAQGVRTDLPLLSGSLLLYLCGRFEYFVRELVSTIVDDLVDSVSTYDELPPALRKQALLRTLEINGNPGKFDYDAPGAAALAAQLADNLSGRNDGSANLLIDAKIVTITESNMRPDVLADLFKRVGIDGLWNTLGKQLTLKSHMGKTRDEECKRATMARLEDIMNERNRVAHPTGSNVFPDAASVEAVSLYFRALAQVLAELALVPHE